MWRQWKFVFIRFPSRPWFVETFFFALDFFGSQNKWSDSKHDAPVSVAIFIRVCICFFSLYRNQTVFPNYRYSVCTVYSARPVFIGYNAEMAMLRLHTTIRFVWPVSIGWRRYDLSTHLRLSRIESLRKHYFHFSIAVGMIYDILIRRTVQSLKQQIHNNFPRRLQ